MVNGTEWGFVTGVTIDGSAPEDLINCIGGTLRRRHSSTYMRNADAVVLYDNIADLSELTGGLVFQIVLQFENPDTSNPDNIGQTLTIVDCRIQDHNITIGESSTFKMSGRAKNRTIQDS